jgi:alpha-mannosidase
LRALSTRPGETAARWLRRAECQIAFARAFAGVLPDQAESGGWREMIDSAQARLDGFDPNAGLFGLSSVVQDAERDMAAIGEAAKRYTIHCVGHGHIDMNWMWSWPETVAVTHDTFASVLSLMDQYPDLTFSQSQASVYALIERYHPEMFEQIKQRVREAAGRSAPFTGSRATKTSRPAKVCAAICSTPGAIFRKSSACRPKTRPLIGSRTPSATRSPYRPFWRRPA